MITSQELKAEPSGRGCAHRRWLKAIRDEDVLYPRDARAASCPAARPRRAPEEHAEPRSNPQYVSGGWAPVPTRIRAISYN